MIYLKTMSYFTPLLVSYLASTIMNVAINEYILQQLEYDCAKSEFNTVYVVTYTDTSNASIILRKLCYKVTHQSIALEQTSGSQCSNQTRTHADFQVECRPVLDTWYCKITQDERRNNSYVALALSETSLGS